ncbi:hypothetical protein [Reyranella sp.]|uniref:hypothetical protein n=1 Tax=Reyranella sp. TaxID=1929291 RepID=UPI003D0CF67D
MTKLITNMEAAVQLRRCCSPRILMEGLERGVTGGFLLASLEIGFRQAHETASLIEVAIIWGVVLAAFWGWWRAMLNIESLPGNYEYPGRTSDPKYLSELRKQHMRLRFRVTGASPATGGLMAFAGVFSLAILRS